jgi:predicted transcriptional regulator
VAPQLEVTAPTAQPITSMPVEWQVLNKDELKKLVTELDNKQDPNYAVFVLTPQGFKNLALNMNEMKRYIQEQKEIIKFYKKINTHTGQAMRD